MDSLYPNLDEPEPKRFTAKTAKSAKFLKGSLCVLRVLCGSKILAQKQEFHL